MTDRTVVEPRLSARAGPGTRLNDLYEIDSLLAVGGMGEVFRGHVIETGDAVAIKTIRPDFAGNAQALTLFRKEAAALHDVHHGAVVRYLVFATDPRLGLPYLAMEFVTGESVEERLQRGPLSFDEIEILRRRLAGGLQAAHEAGIVHRDVSPDNVILPGGSPARAKIIDFGIARSATGKTVIGDSFAGKYDYVSPEQLGLYGGDVTARSDIYSFGLVLAQASRGRALDMGDNPADFIRRRSALPDLSDVDSRLRPLLEAMLQPEPTRRPQSMAEIEAWQPASVVARSGPAPAGMKRWLYAGGGLGLVAAGVLLTATALLPPGLGPPRIEPSPPLSESNGSSAPLPQVPPQTLAPTERPAQSTARSDPGQPVPEAPGGMSVLEPVKPTVEPRADAAQPPLSAPPREPSHGVSGMERVAAFIRDYRGGSCFFLNPMTVGAREATVEAYGVDPRPFQAFDVDFKKALGFEANIHLRQVEAGQCAVVELMAAQAQAKPSTVPLMKLDGDRIRNGEMLRGELELPASRTVKLLLVEGDGTLHDLTSYLQRSRPLAKFAVRIEKPSSEAWRPQLLLAVTSPRPLPAASDGSRANAVLPALARDAAEPGGTLGLTVRYLKAGG